MPFDVGAPELIIILVIVMLVFGVGKLPEVGGAIGKGIREFRKASSETASPELEEMPAPRLMAGASWPCGRCAADNPAQNVFCGRCGTARASAALAAERS